MVPTWKFTGSAHGEKPTWKTQGDFETEPEKKRVLSVAGPRQGDHAGDTARLKQ